MACSLEIGFGGWEETSASNFRVEAERGDSKWGFTQWQWHYNKTQQNKTNSMA
jgi:hypothetical protein